jgi:drug/metabolite transporter (DMT)-like permease
LAFLTLYLVWGSTYLAIKWVVADMPPFVAVVIRQGVAGLVLFAWALSRGVARPTRDQWRVAFIVGTMLLAVGNGMVNWASQQVPSGLVSLIVSSLPIWIVGLQWARPNGTPPSRREAGGVVLGSLGIVALVWSAGGIGAATGNARAVLIGCLALLVSSCSWAAGSLYSRGAPRHPDGSMATGIEMLAAAVVLIPVSFLTGDVARFDPASVSAVSWLALAYLIVFGSVIAFSAYNWLLRVTTPAQVSTYAYVNPVVAVLLGTTLGGERLTPGLVLASVLVLGAVVLLTLPKPKKWGR